MRFDSSEPERELVRGVSRSGVPFRVVRRETTAGTCIALRIEDDRDGMEACGRFDSPSVYAFERPDLRDRFVFGVAERSIARVEVASREGVSSRGTALGVKELKAFAIDVPSESGTVPDLRQEDAHGRVVRTLRIRFGSRRTSGTFESAEDRAREFDFGH